MILRRSMLVFVLVSVVTGLAVWVYRDWSSEEAGSLVVDEASLPIQVAGSLGLGSIVGFLAAGGYALWARGKALRAREEYED